MKKIKLLIWVSLLFTATFIIFTFLDIGLTFDNPIKLINPVLFAGSLIIAIFLPLYRRFLLYGSVVLLICMAIFYLFNQLELANWIGSLGFGILVITIVSYCPNFIKKGYIENF